ncbi:MAG: DUF898 family protein [Burkholderiaceae bacterium]
MTDIPAQPLPQPAADDAADPAPARDTDGGSAGSLVPIAFTGSGAEYFGIWIVNLLLMILTLGLYYPWARVRKLKYFASSTEIGGYPMHFNGVPRRMFGGFVVAALAFLIYTFGEFIHPLVSTLAFVSFALLWPWLLRAALRFRLAKTDWRGVPLAFRGSLRDAYLSLLPGFAVLACLALLGGAFGTWQPTVDVSDPRELIEEPGFWLTASLGLALLLAIPLLLPWLHFRLTRYRQSHYGFTSLTSRFTASLGDFYRAYLKTGLVGLLALGLAVATLGFLVLLVYGLESMQQSDAMHGALLASIPIMIGLLVLLWQVFRAFFETVLFNLVWGSTEAQGLQLYADLSFWRVLGVRLLNMVLIMLTIGLYTPFAIVAITRLKLHALSLASSTDLDALVGEAASGRLSAASDAAADLFDLDIGL